MRLEHSSVSASISEPYFYVHIRNVNVFRSGEVFKAVFRYQSQLLNIFYPEVFQFSCVQSRRVKIWIESDTCNIFKAILVVSNVRTSEEIIICKYLDRHTVTL